MITILVGMIALIAGIVIGVIISYESQKESPYGDPKETSMFESLYRMRDEIKLLNSRISFHQNSEIHKDVEHKFQTLYLRVNQLDDRTRDIDLNKLKLVLEMVDRVNIPFDESISQLFKNGAIYENQLKRLEQEILLKQKGRKK